MSILLFIFFFLYFFIQNTQVRYCKFVKEKYWHSYNEGRLDKLAFRDLADAEEAMIDITDRYFITLEHHIKPMLEKEKVIADVCWNTFQWQDYVISGELKQFTNSLSKLTDIPNSLVFLSTIPCCAWLVRRHLYFFVHRARDIASCFIHAHEEVSHDIEHNSLFPSDIAGMLNFLFFYFFIFF